jgi:hypothetical protein
MFASCLLMQSYGTLGHPPLPPAHGATCVLAHRSPPPSPRSHPPAGPISGVIMFMFSMALTQFAILNVVRVKAALQLRQRVEPPEREPHHSIDADETARSPLLRQHREAINASPTAPDGKRRNPRGVELDYTSLMSEIFGWGGEWAAMFAIFVASYGSCVAYLKFIHDNMLRFFPGALPDPQLWVWLTCIPLCGLAWPDTVDFLAPFSLMGLIASFSFAVLVLYVVHRSLPPAPLLLSCICLHTQRQYSSNPTVQVDVIELVVGWVGEWVGGWVGGFWHTSIQQSHNSAFEIPTCSA